MKYARGTRYDIDEDISQILQRLLSPAAMIVTTRFHQACLIHLKYPADNLSL